MTNIGTIIAETRRNRGLTQAQLSEQSGVDYNTLIKIEGGTVEKPRAENIRSIAEALGVPENFLTEDRQEGFKAQVQGSDLLPFNSHSPADFERMIFMLIDDSKDEWKDAEHHGGTGDLGRDIMARALASAKFTIFQAKKYKEIDFGVLQKDMDKIHERFFGKGADEKKQPEKIIFCLASPATSALKDKVREYGQKIGLPECVTWGAIELDSKVRRHKSVIDEFFGGHEQEILRETKELKEIAIGTKRGVDGLQQMMTERSVTSNEQQDVVLRTASRLTNENKFVEALAILFPLKQQLEEQKDTTKLHEVYNNIGVCHANDTDRRNWEVAIEYFQKARDQKPDFDKATRNLIIALLNTTKKENWERALKLAKEKFDALPLEEGFVTFYITAMDRLAKTEELKVFLRDHPELKQKAADNAELATALGHAYVRAYHYDDAISLAEEGVKKFPDSYNLHLVLGRALLYRADEKDRTDDRYADVTPRFRDDSVIVRAKQELEKALELARADKQSKMFICTILLDLLTCAHVLHDESFASIKDQIDFTAVPSDITRQIMIRDFGRRIDERNFEAAFLLLKSDTEFWEHAPYQEVRRLAAIFLDRGSPENAIKLLSKLKDEAIQAGDEQYWFMLATAYAVLGKKTEALSTMEEAKRIFTGKAQYAKVLPFYGGMMARYSHDGESERLLPAMQEMQEANPEKRIVWPIKAFEDDGSISNEVKDMFKQWADDYRTKKEMILEKLLPLYLLQRLFRRSFPEAIVLPAAEGDFDFVLNYTFVNKEFLEAGNSNFEKADTVMMDYASLYNLAKTRCLGLLQMSKKKILVHSKLFEQIQEDLMQNEDAIVREVWDFVRDPANVELITTEPASWELFPKKSSDVFDEWLITTLEYVREKKLLLICDDMNLLRMVQGKGVEATSTFCVLQWAEGKAMLDKKQYALALASLAELFYSFIPFNGKDLFYIAIDDEDKVKWRKVSSGFFDKSDTLQISHRFFHLIHQVKLPGSHLQSFLSAILNFMEELAKTGVLFSEKAKYLHFFTFYFTNWLREKIGEGQVSEKDIDDMATFFGRIWAAVIARVSSQEEIDELKEAARVAFRDRPQEGKFAELSPKAALDGVMTAIERQAERIKKEGGLK